MFLASGCYSVASYGGGGLGRTWELVGRGGWAAVGGGGRQRGGEVGAVVGVSSTSKKRPSHHKYKYPKQFELKQS